MTEDEREFALLSLEDILEELKAHDAQGSTFTHLSPAKISALVKGIRLAKKLIIAAKDE